MAGETILVMDDDPTPRHLAILLLEEAGYNVLVAEDGSEGLDVLRANAVDLIVSDIETPVMDGPAMCKQAHDEHRNGRHMYMTGGTSDDNDKERARATNPYAIMDKPYMPAEFLDTVAKALAQPEAH